tara:strand:- start:3483 stop:3749 length:267 start_codon:yes stop_codon:yes gene_type:complete
MKVTPLGARVLIKPVAKKETTDSGIFLPKEQQLQIPQGTVVSVGKLVKEVSVGDYVQWTMADDAKEFMHNDETHLILYEAAFIVKLEK